MKTLFGRHMQIFLSVRSNVLRQPFWFILDYSVGQPTQVYFVRIR